MATNEVIFEESTAQKVIKSLLAHYGYNIMELGMKLGLKNSAAIYEMYHGRTKKMSKKTIDIFKITFPELRVDFLMTGRGSMFENEKEPEQKAPTPTPPIVQDDLVKIMLHMMNTMQEQTLEIRRLREEMADIKASIATPRPYPVTNDYQSGVVDYGISPENTQKKVADDGDQNIV